MVPNCAVHTTLVFDVPVTAAENCFDSPGLSVTEVGDIEIATFGCGLPPPLGCGLLVPPELFPPPEFPRPEPLAELPPPVVLSTALPESRIVMRFEFTASG